MFIAGIGPFAAQPGPEGETIWSPQTVISSSLFDNPVEVNVLLTEGRSADPALIATVLGDLDRYLLLGLRFLHAELIADPVSFDSTPAGVRRFERFDPATFPVDLPQLNFYDSIEWLLRFAEGGLPICEPHGVAVVFANHEPIRVEDLRDSTPI
ncbi:hypothetical protein ACIRRA_41005 [Nocardia sp. NPDC101769]|uniref:hypothetical protein n=1 Tax=Nocardia sp. NPDC101769 TaxID=3364333 RepID=UPI0038046EF7